METLATQTLIRKMDKRISFKQIQKDERGASLLEFTFVCPLMVFLLFVSVDFTMYLQSYFRATHVLREGLRVAAVTPSLAVAESVNNDLPDPGHQAIHRRIQMLLDVESYNTSTKTSIDGSGLRLKDNNGTYSENLEVRVERLADDRVEIRFHGNYNSLLAGIVGSFPLSYRVVGSTPYLYTM